MDLWVLYIRLHNARPGGFSGPQPITFEAMAAYQHLTWRVILPWEAAAVSYIDVSYRDELAKISAEDSAKS